MNLLIFKSLAYFFALYATPKSELTLNLKALKESHVTLQNALLDYLPVCGRYHSGQSTILRSHAEAADIKRKAKQLAILNSSQNSFFFCEF